MKTIYSRKTALLCACFFLSLIGFAFTYSSAVVKNPNVVAANKAGAVKRPSSKVDLKAIALSNVEFDFNRNSIREKSYAELDRVAKLLVDNNGSIQLSGHADNKGPYVYNWHLSKRRADAVKAYLIKKGANEERVASVEFGDTKPIASNATKSGRQKNRRVEMAFL